MTKTPSKAQTRFITAILNRGTTNVPGPKLFQPRIEADTATGTIKSVQARGWVRRTEHNGVAYWSVTRNGCAAVGVRRVHCPHNGCVVVTEYEAEMDQHVLTPHHLAPCGCLKNDAGAHRVGCPDHPEGVQTR